MEGKPAVSSQSQRSQLSSLLANPSNELVCELQIVLSLFLFGTSFVCQKQAMVNGMQPITYNFCRYFVSSVVLWVLKDGFGWRLQIDDADSINVSTREGAVVEQVKDARRELERRQLIQYAIILGLCNYGGSMLQQIGLVTVTAGKTGFITGMFVVFVPLVEYIFIPKYRGNMTLTLLGAVSLSFAGLYLLSGCMEQEVCLGSAIKQGEMIVFVSMLFWVMSIIVADYGAKTVEVISLTYYEFLLTTTLTLLSALYFEPENFVYPFTSIRENWAVIVTVGVTEALAFAFSTLGQMYTPPSKAAVLFSMEAVVCAILAYLFLKESLTHLEFFGAVLMTLAALIASLSSESDEDDAQSALQDDLAHYYDAVEKQGLIGESNGDDEDIPLTSAQPNYYQYNTDVTTATTTLGGEERSQKYYTYRKPSQSD